MAVNQRASNVNVGRENEGEGRERVGSQRVRLPQIAGRANRQLEQRYASEESLNSLEQSLENKLLRSRWKLNRPYIEGYVQERKSLKQVLEDTTNLKSSPKAANPNIFFTAVAPADTDKAAHSRQETQSCINKSKEIIGIIKANRKKLIKFKIAEQQRERTNQSDMARIRTQPHDPSEIVSYLRRDIVAGKELTIDEELVDRYISYSPCSKLQKIEEKGRKFLLSKMQTDYHKYTQVESYKREQVKLQIEEELRSKKKRFDFDYKNRYSTPYFAFLSLSAEERLNILEKQSLKSQKQIML